MSQREMWKYAVKINDRPHALPGEVKAVGRGNLINELSVWVLVDPDHLVPTAAYQVFGTGHPLPVEAYYIDTVIDPPYVWHLFEVAPALEGVMTT